MTDIFFAGVLSPDGALIWLAVWRIILGIGVGGDYPMSASVTSDRATLRKRGTMLAYIFSNQGWGSFFGGLVTIIVLLCYKHVMHTEGHTSKIDGGEFDVNFFNFIHIILFIVWRIVIGVSLIPAFGTLYQRLTLAESTRFLATKKLRADEESPRLKVADEDDEKSSASETATTTPTESHQVIKKKAHFTGMRLADRLSLCS